MRVSDLQYELPRHFIAQQPIEPRDASRLLVLHRASGEIEHRVFRDVLDYLKPDDCLVLNNARVLPARFYCRRATGGRVEGLFLRVDGDGWRVLLKPSNRLRVGEVLTPFRYHGAPDTNGSPAPPRLKVVAQHPRGEWIVRPQTPTEPTAMLYTYGEVPLPPYVERPNGPDSHDPLRYQTVYASSDGAVAAPTAGLHFTPELLARAHERGVRRAEVTLHVGIGTFAPIDAADLREHKLHAEWYRVGADALETVRASRANGGRVIAVGTTSARALESLTSATLTPAEGWTDLFVYPPYAFKNVDVLLTNFHLPGSTLIALVMAFAGREPVLRAYREAIERGYRFYSYGDAMLVL
ncbi:MAG: tRNA preQ1(34) S-adenosylmethionine ribosyltransferase-isomerase QueA [Phycisphaerae bacterium]